MNLIGSTCRISSRLFPVGIASKHEAEAKNWMRRALAVSVPSELDGELAAKRVPRDEVRGRGKVRFPSKLLESLDKLLLSDDNLLVGAGIDDCLINLSEELRGGLLNKSGWNRGGI